MARPIVLSNGEMHVGINKYGLVHDFYYPYVGLENHAADNALRHHIGVWIDGTLSWLDDESWEIHQSYPHNALIGHTTALHEKMGIMLEFDDAICGEANLFMRNIHVINLRDTPRSIRLFMHQAFIIGDSRSNTDTAQYLPDSKAILHYRGRRVFIVSGSHKQKSFDQYAVGLFGIEGHDGTWRDAEDGELSGSNVEHGRVDSTLRFVVPLEAHDSTRVQYWIAAGTSMREALHIHHIIAREGIDERLTRTYNWWQTWLKPAQRVAEHIDEKYRKSFLDSAMIIKSQIDKRGAVMASTDSALLKNWRDAYAYCWPRDAAYALWPLIRIGYKEEPLRFFDFCRRNMHPNGYLMHKYRSDGALGSSWHPYVHKGGVIAPPIQEDETALTLFVFLEFYDMHPSEELLHDYYQSLVLPMAEFLSSYIDPHTHLPRPSYDIWEERFMTTTYTTALVYAALLSAADCAEKRGDADHAVAWRSCADDIHASARKYLYDSGRRVFYKGITIDEQGGVSHSEIVDASSIYGAFMFGLFAADSYEVSSSVAYLLNASGKTDATTGLPRYADDAYFRDDAAGRANNWLVVSLWMAEYYIEIEDMDTAFGILSWVQSVALESGVMPEQVHPETGANMSVAPLIWSHAEYIATLLDTITEKQK